MMRKMLIVSVILALFATAFALPRRALAAESRKFSGQNAFADFFSMDGSGCIGTSVFVFAMDGKFKSGPGPWSTGGLADIAISQYDFCTDTPLFSASGGICLCEGEFVVDRKLSTASLNTTIPLFDYVAGTPVDVSVNLVWTGVGDLSRGSSTFHSQAPGCSFHGHAKGSSRSAEVSGTVLVGVTNFTPGAGSGSLSSTQVGNVTIGCQ